MIKIVELLMKINQIYQILKKILKKNDKNTPVLV